MAQVHFDLFYKVERYRVCTWYTHESFRQRLKTWLFSSYFTCSAH